MSLSDVFKKLKTTAERNCWMDDRQFVLDEFCNDNIHDAFDGGFECGEVQLAREIFEDLNKEAHFLFLKKGDKINSDFLGVGIVVSDWREGYISISFVVVTFLRPISACASLMASIVLIFII
jgi:hypothetical protein